MAMFNLCCVMIPPHPIVLSFQVTAHAGKRLMNSGVSLPPRYADPASTATYLIAVALVSASADMPLMTSAYNTCHATFDYLMTVAAIL
jgi:hypothetical protein